MTVISTYPKKCCHEAAAKEAGRKGASAVQCVIEKIKNEAATEKSIAKANCYRGSRPI
jgi:hypothetical protein